MTYTLPLKVVEATGTTFIYDANDEVVALVQGDDHLENAQEIVRACNAHELKKPCRGLAASDPTD
jgi:hypothetical protein